MKTIDTRFENDLPRLKNPQYIQDRREVTLPLSRGDLTFETYSYRSVFMSYVEAAGLALPLQLGELRFPYTTKLLQLFAVKNTVAGSTTTIRMFAGTAENESFLHDFSPFFLNNAGAEILELPIICDRVRFEAVIMDAACDPANIAGAAIPRFLPDARFAYTATALEVRFGLSIRAFA